MGVTTMKMISSTSITSTIGVTLMSELTLPLRSALLMPWNSVSCLRTLPPPEICHPYRECRASPPGPYQQLMGSNQPVGSEGPSPET
jgi:hypothetical protein